jgi:predicted component of type VI protein secretion system
LGETPDDRIAGDDGGDRRAGVGLVSTSFGSSWARWAWRNFSAFCPAAPVCGGLVDWVRNYVGDELLWDVNLILRKEEVPPLASWARKSQLGWTTWLTSQPPDRMTSMI